MPPTSRPNIVLIMVDDMGFSDIGCYGSEIATPNLDRLARGGVVFTQMYNTSRCCPTRASILTGLHPHQAGVGDMTGDWGHPGYRGHLNDRCVTIAEALRPAGYRTFMSGKWHVGGSYDRQHPETWTAGDAGHPTPCQRGFDEHYGTYLGAGNYFNPPTLALNGRYVEADGGDFYYTDAISDHACRFIRKAAGDAQPFFLYVAHVAPHWPLHARPEDIALYRGRYACGWDAVRTARHERLKGAGLLDARWPISPRDPQAPPWDDLPPGEKDMQDARMAVYAAQLHRMDLGVGRLLDTLDECGLADNTLVMFLSDNGGCHEFIDHRGSWKDRLAMPTRSGRPMVMGDAPGVYPGPEETYQSYNVPWANASNTPFRLYKHWVHEGGIATPLIVRAPGGAGRGGAVTHTLGHVIDILPTCLDAAGASYPAEHGGRAVTPTEGQSLLPYVRGRRGDDLERTLFWEHEGNRAVRKGRWKLVARHKGPWELYDTIEDRTELNDLAAAKPDTVRDMTRMYDEWAATHDVLPIDQARPG